MKRYPANKPLNRFFVKILTMNPGLEIRFQNRPLYLVFQNNTKQIIKKIYFEYKLPLGLNIKFLVFQVHTILLNSEIGYAFEDGQR